MTQQTCFRVTTLKNTISSVQLTHTDDIIELGMGAALYLVLVRPFFIVRGLIELSFILNCGKTITGVQKRLSHERVWNKCKIWTIRTFWAADTCIVLHLTKFDVWTSVYVRERNISYFPWYSWRAQNKKLSVSDINTSHGETQGEPNRYMVY